MYLIRNVPQSGKPLPSLFGYRYFQYVLSLMFLEISSDDKYFKAKDISDFLYQIQFRKKPLNLTYNKEKIKVKSDSISIDIYDASLEDGDIINLFTAKKIILQNYFARNEKKRIYLVKP